MNSKPFRPITETTPRQDDETGRLAQLGVAPRCNRCDCVKSLDRVLQGTQVWMCPACKDAEFVER